MSIHRSHQSEQKDLIKKAKVEASDEVQSLDSDENVDSKDGSDDKVAFV